MNDELSEEGPAARSVVRGLTAMVNQRGGVMNMRLDPPELGELRIQMSLARGVVSAEFQATTSQAQAALEKNLVMLRQSLESQGLVVDRLTVHAPPPSGGAARDDSPTPQGYAYGRPNHDAAGGESRGRRDQGGDEPTRSFRHMPFHSLLDSDAGADLRDLLAAV